MRPRKAHPYEALFKHIEPGQDEFTGEIEAARIASQLERLVETRALPLADDFVGASPQPARYREIARGVFRAEFAPGDFRTGMQDWLRPLGQVRAARWFPLPGNRVRYEISSATARGLQYRVGIWDQAWSAGRLSRFAPREETLVTADRPLFQDVSAQMFHGAPSFAGQMLRGVPYWRARLDSACGIDVYGNNGIAVGDIDGDGWDEVYVCQPGGLPNRLYKNQGPGKMVDITDSAGVGVLDDSASALFLDLRNTGRQDLVVLTTAGPLLFLNQGDATFRHKPEAFRFASRPQGTFTGMAAADYDQDGKLDLYLCTYIYFQSEDQYRYPVPYHDAQNGPPNFLFRNRLGENGEDGEGFLEDVTAAAGLDQNNNRYSFAPAWCDYDGDGWPDLYVANDFGRNNLYKNERGRFRDVAAEAGVEDLGPGMSAAWFDYDGDGRPDLYVANMWTAAGQRVAEDKAFPLGHDPTLREAYRRHSKGNSLYRNLGGGRFEETGAAQGVEMGRWAWSADGLDLDNDGSPEIYIAAGMLSPPRRARQAQETPEGVSTGKDLEGFFWRQVVARSPAQNKAAPAYENGWNALNQLIREDYGWNGGEANILYARRAGRFYDFSGVSGLDFADDSRAFAASDFDGDGNLDLFLKSRMAPQVRALRNDWGTQNHALAIRLRGTRSNRDAIGARIEIESDIGRRVQYLQAGSGYLSQHTKQIHLGLGQANTARKLRIVWPSGQVQEFAELAAGFRYDITEGVAEVKRTPFLRRDRPLACPDRPEACLSVENEPLLAPVWLLEPLPLPHVQQTQASRRAPGFLCLVNGTSFTSPSGFPLQVLDLKEEPADLAACFALFWRYLLDYRTDLRLPLLILVDQENRAHRVYPSIPEAAALRRDLQSLGADRARLALPFPGRYYALPRRNYFRLGAAFYWAGLPEQASLYLNAVLQQMPDNFRARLALAQTHLEAGRHQAARPHAERAVALNPGSPEAWNSLGGVEMAAQNHTAALDHFRKALAIQPDLPYVLINAGQAYQKRGDLEPAEKMFRRALELDANDADAANHLGLVLARRDRNEEARVAFQQAITARRDHAGAINNLGVLYTQMDKLQDAIAAFQYGLRVAPEDETMAMNLARVYIRLGEREKARQVLEEMVARKPDSSITRKALRELERP